MAARTLTVLHVEDDPFQQKLMAHHLQAIHDFRFAVTCARGEHEATAAFARQPADLVIMDYQLTEGDGLSCLQTLRRHDAAVPIIAVSGKATPEVAAELLKCGADDYISKRDLTSDVLGKSIRMAIRRADAWQRRGRPAAPAGPRSRFAAGAETLTRHFLGRLGAPFWQYLGECESAARDAHLTADQVRDTFEEMSATLLACPEEDVDLRRRLLRPLVLELQARLADEAVTPP